jgi:hypothetical protein
VLGVLLPGGAVGGRAGGTGAGASAAGAFGAASPVAAVHGRGDDARLTNLHELAVHVRGKRLLYVDANARSRGTTAHSLYSWGLSVRATGSLDDAALILSQTVTPYACVLLAWQPDATGVFVRSLAESLARTLCVLLVPVADRARASAECVVAGVRPVLLGMPLCLTELFAVMHDGGAQRVDLQRLDRMQAVSSAMLASTGTDASLPLALGSERAFMSAHVDRARAGGLPDGSSVAESTSDEAALAAVAAMTSSSFSVPSSGAVPGPAVAASPAAAAAPAHAVSPRNRGSAASSPAASPAASAAVPVSPSAASASLAPGAAIATVAPAPLAGVRVLLAEDTVRGTRVRARRH